MKKNILVIGGGPAGMMAAAELENLDYNVILVEKEKRLGGHLAKWDRLFPLGTPAEDALNKLLTKLSDTKCFTETFIHSINILDKSYNVILSNGVTVLADALLITSGFDLFKAQRKEEYGYGIYNHVVTNADLENFYKTGNDSRIDNPKKIGFVHCVGSRDEKIGNLSCSKVCCATALKQACEIKEKFPKAEVYCFYMDLRMFGRYFEDLYLKAQKEYGIRFIRGRVSEVSEKIDRTLQVKAEDTLQSKPLKITLDLLVLMAGMQPSAEGKKVGEMLGLKEGGDGFFETQDILTGALKSNLPGVFYAGACTGPKTLPETLNEAKAVALEIDKYLW